MDQMDMIPFTGTTQKLRKWIYSGKLSDDTLQKIFMYSLHIKRESFIALFLNYDPWSFSSLYTAYTIAIDSRDLKLCKILLRIKPLHMDYVIRNVLATSNNMAKLFFSRGYIFNSENINDVVIYATDSVFRYLFKKGYLTKYEFNIVSLRFKVREILHLIGHTGIPDHSMSRLLDYGCFLHEHKKKIIETGNLNKVKVIYEHGYTFPEYCDAEHEDVREFLHCKRLSQYAHCPSDCSQCKQYRYLALTNIWQMES